ncbi:MAG: DNA translocase FtsK, partial [bacterium]|nr:DNA translocase FtsK [bacterium]
MGRRKKNEEEDEKESWLQGEVGHFFELHADAKKSIAAILLFGIGILLLLSSAGKAGPAGNSIYGGLSYLFGWGYFIMPALLIISGFVFLMADRKRVVGITLFGSLFLFISSLGIIDILSPSGGGLLGQGIGTIKIPFGYTASLVVTISIFLASLVATLNMPIKLKNPFARNAVGKDAELTAKEEEHIAEATDETADESEETNEDNNGNEDDLDEVDDSEEERSGRSIFGFKKKAAQLARYEGSYVFPPLSLLRSSIEKPTSGDLRANANIIKRTLESFGVPVEMGEISVGPKVTRYTLKPAEGVKIAQINSLNQDLALALAAHPIRIEAPIPGKSLVGIEVPNKSAAIVRLGSMLNYKEFMENGLLSFVLGRDVTGDPIMADLTKMPHLLIAGATGSGKSVAIHSLILSLLYKNSPETLRLVMIDPKRVELTVYNGLPHLVSPVVTDGKKTTNVFRWAISEMEDRYKKLEAAGNRDIKSYNADHKKEP